MHLICIRAIIYASLFVSFASSAQSLNPSNNNNNAAAALPIVEGSGSIPPSSNVDKNVVAADIDWEASGVGPDDEDGDVIEGSGNVPEVEGSGIPPPKEPSIAKTSTTVGVIPIEKSTTSTSAVTKPTSSSPIPIVATTVITITTEDTKRQEEDIFNAQKPIDDNELKFGGEDGDGDDVDGDDDDDDDDDEDDDPSTTTETTTTSRETSSTSTTTTKRPPSIAIGTEPPVDGEEEEDAFHNMFKPGILAAITGGAVVGILLAILLVMFIVYRIRKKDEGSYSVDESSHHQPHNYSYAYQKAATKEFYA